jgi:hypothetical protein
MPNSAVVQSLTSSPPFAHLTHPHPWIVSVTADDVVIQLAPAERLPTVMLLWGQQVRIWLRLLKSTRRLSIEPFASIVHPARLVL